MVVETSRRPLDGADGVRTLLESASRPSLGAPPPPVRGASLGGGVALVYTTGCLHPDGTTRLLVRTRRSLCAHNASLSCSFRLPVQFSKRVGIGLYRDRA